MPLMTNTNPERNILHPGDICPTSGVYDTVELDGRFTSVGEIVSTKGHPMPPTPEPNLGYVLRRQAHHANENKK